jgi:hypothetical protein
MASRLSPHPAVLALRVLTLMHQRGLSVRNLVKQSGIALSGVQDIIAGKRNHVSVWTVYALADVFGVSLDYLTGRCDALAGQRTAEACTPEAPLSANAPAPPQYGVPAVQAVPTAPASPLHHSLSLPAPQYRCLDCGGTDFWDSGSRRWCRQCTPPLRHGPLLRLRR